ncbi:MAG: hypothetical protein K0R59_1533 [Sphingobacterium sp.]|jgi:hypothetical protein|uniref:hypothetical protein n=1 Tax=unclassified Sphingobacterium TaxID=2609468 RepID=UPI000984AE4B|nr:hypothetical protein [Sphingobacterium sp. CZ-UAM]MDF2516237.1 hypothetical protein [Sphingobacterium sp.]OOG17496.1 hypothetical protein BWD42_14980 [Sphingobacterium sp. CZ-UAM]
MKNTQKKLKAKHFRYLSKEYIADPLKYLKEFFEQETYVHYFVKDINLLVNAASNAKMNSPYSNLGYNTKKLITFVEIAYVIFKKCSLKKLKNPLDFFKCDSDYWNYVSGECLSVNDIESPEDEISRFFSFQSLGQWYEVLDEIWINMSDRNGEFLGNVGKEILATRELLQRLAISLHKIYENKSLPDNSTNNQEEIESEKNQDQTSLEQTDNIKTKEGSFDDAVENEIFSLKKQVTLPPWLAPQPFSIKAVQDFFSHGCLDRWKEHIKYWHRAAITENCFWSVGQESPYYGGSTLLFNYSCIYSLLEMFRNEADLRKIDYVAKDPNQQILIRDTATITVVNNDDKFHLSHTNTEQLEDLFLSIAKLINQYTKIEWDEILYDWLEYGLSKEAYANEDFSNQTLLIYDILINIVELAYILAYENEIEILDTVAN